MGAQYEMGPFAILVGHEIHYDLFGLSANVPSALRNNATSSGVHSKDQATAIAFKYKIGVHQFEIDANRKKYDEPTDVIGKVRSYQNNAYMFIWEMKLDPQWRTEIHYVKATAGKCTIVAQECNTRRPGGLAAVGRVRLQLLEAHLPVRDGLAGAQRLLGRVQQQQPAGAEPGRGHPPDRLRHRHRSDWAAPAGARSCRPTGRARSRRHHLCAHRAAGARRALGGCIVAGGAGIIQRLAIGISAYQYDGNTTTVASNSGSETTLPTIDVQGVR